MAKKIAYTGVFLNEQSHEALLRWFEQTAGRPLLGKIHGHHMTIQFKPSPEDLAALPAGQTVKVRVVAWAADELAQAVVVEPEVASKKAVPHITVATADGTSPAYSNDLLAFGATPVDGPTLEGVVGTFPPRET